MDEENSLPEPKISTVEIILIGSVFILFDLIEIIFVFFLLDDFWIIDAISAMIFLYLALKGVPAMRQLISWVVELVPWVGALPLLTLGWGLTVWADRHPSSALAKAGEVASATKGKGVTSSPAPQSIRGAGAKSLQHMERAGEGTKEWQERMPRATTQGATNYTASSPFASPQETGGRSTNADIDERAFGMPGEPVEELKEGLFSNTPGAQGVRLDQNAIHLNR